MGTYNYNKSRVLDPIKFSSIGILKKFFSLFTPKVYPKNFDLFKHLLIKLNPTFAKNLLKKFFSFAKKFFGPLGTLNLPKNNIVWLSDLLIKTLFLKTQKPLPKRNFFTLIKKIFSPFSLQNLLKKFLKNRKNFHFFIEINFYLWRLNL